VVADHTLKDRLSCHLQIKIGVIGRKSGETQLCLRREAHAWEGPDFRLRKNSGFDFALKGRGFSRAVSH
jgi:hypothetical protein